MHEILSVAGVSKTYASGLRALNHIDLAIRRGEIFALLGPNGAGKTTLIGIVCGIVTASTGRVTVDGHDIVRDWRFARERIGLVPQELTTDAFESVWGTVSFSRGLFGKPPNPAHIEKTLKALSLWDKKDSKIITLSGGMKRRLLIAKALAHEPQLLFLDEPTAGVDVNLRRDMWQLVRELRDTGVTIILTTHYIEEAEQMADRHARTRGPAAAGARGAGRLPRHAVGGRRRADLHLRQAARPCRHRAAAEGAGRAGHRDRGSAHHRKLAGGHLRRPAGAAGVSPPGRPKGEHRSAQREGTPVSAHGRSKAFRPERAARRVVRWR